MRKPQTKQISPITEKPGKNHIVEIRRISMILYIRLSCNSQNNLAYQQFTDTLENPKTISFSTTHSVEPKCIEVTINDIQFKNKYESLSRHGEAEVFRGYLEEPRTEQKDLNAPESIDDRLLKCEAGNPETNKPINTEVLESQIKPKIYGNKQLLQIPSL